MASDGPEQRFLDQRELADVSAPRCGERPRIRYDAWWDRQLDRADHMLDQHKESVIDLDSPEFAAMVDHFLSGVMR